MRYEDVKRRGGPAAIQRAEAEAVHNKATIQMLYGTRGHRGDGLATAQNGGGKWEIS